MIEFTTANFIDAMLELVDGPAKRTATAAILAIMSGNTSLAFKLAKMAEEIDIRERA